MFADDTTLTISGKSVSDVEIAINDDLAQGKGWLSANKLSLNVIKTEYLLIGSRHNVNNLSVVPKCICWPCTNKKGETNKSTWSLY